MTYLYWLVWCRPPGWRRVRWWCSPGREAGTGAACCASASSSAAPPPAPPTCNQQQMRNVEQSTSDVSADILQNVNNGPRKIERHSGIVQMGSSMTILKWNESLYHKGSHVYTSWLGGRCCKIWGHHCFYHPTLSPINSGQKNVRYAQLLSLNPESSSAQNLHKYPATNIIRAQVQIHPLLS